MLERSLAGNWEEYQDNHIRLLNLLVAVLIQIKGDPEFKRDLSG